MGCSDNKLSQIKNNSNILHNIILSIITIFSILVIIFGLGNAFMPLMLSLGIAYLVFPVIIKLETIGIKRHYAVISVFSITFVLLTLFVILCVPILIQDANLFIKELPKNFANVFEKINIISKDFDIDLPIDKQSLLLTLKKYSSYLSIETIGQSAIFLKSIAGNLHSVLMVILNLFLLPLFFFYIIEDYEKIIATLQSLIPDKFLPQITIFSKKANIIISGYIRGQLLVASILSILYALGLLLIDIKFGLLIGILTGLLSIIPYAGVTIGFISTMIIAVATFNFNTIFWIIILFTIISIIESFFLTPKFVGNKIGLSSFATMLALIIGGNLAGIFGMLIAIPIAGLLKLLLIDYMGVGFRCFRT